MKNKNKIRVLVPVSAPDLNAIFKNLRWADDARALFYYMEREKWIMSKNRDYLGGIDRDSGWVSVNAKEMADELGLSNRLKEIRDTLEPYGCLEVKRRANGNKAYTPTLYSMLYRILVPSLVNGRMYRQEFITDFTTRMNMVNFYNRSYKKQRKEFLSKMEWYRPNLEWAEKMYLDETAVAYAEAQTPKQTDTLLSNIGAFNSKTGRFISVCDFAGRIHSHVGGLNKKLRPFIRVEGEDDELLCIDVKSAQPYLISNLFSGKLMEHIPEFQPIFHKISKRQQDPSTKLFLRHCLDGTLYERLMQATGIKDRNRVKRRLFRHVLYCSASNQHKDKKVQTQRLRFQEQFKSLYRSPFETLVALKRTRSKALPFVKELTSKRGQGKMYATPNMIAQRLEVAIFLNMITKRLNEAGVITVTIHDAWILKKKDHKKFDRVLESVCADMSIQVPMVHVEALNCGTYNIDHSNTEEK